MPQALVALLAGGVLLAGCGPPSDEAARLGRNSIVRDVEPRDENRVGAADLGRTPQDSASRAFLEHWSLLQRRRWQSATLTFDPELLRSVGATRIASALRRQVVTWVAARPRLLGAHKNRYGRVVVRYVIKDPHGIVKRQWISWHRVGGAWRIFYDPVLNFALRVDAERSAQERMDLSARKLSKEARQEGRRAARLQRDYLEQARAEP